jgi:hypothetical protein
MSTVSSREYEFSPSQNDLFGGLARRMRGVGVFLVVVGLLNFLVAALVVLAIYRAKLPEDYVKRVLEKASETTRTDLNARLPNCHPTTSSGALPSATRSMACSICCSACGPGARPARSRGS